MINIISKPLELDYELKKKIEFICDFYDKVYYTRVRNGK